MFSDIWKFRSETPQLQGGAFRAGIGTQLPSVFMATCPELAKADIADHDLVTPPRPPRLIAAAPKVRVRRPYGLPQPDRS